MIIAGPRPGAISGSRGPVRMRVWPARAASGNQPFQRALATSAIGEAEITVPPLAFDRDKPGIFKLGEMPRWRSRASGPPSWASSVAVSAGPAISAMSMFGAGRIADQARR